MSEMDEFQEGLAIGLRKMEEPDYDNEVVHAVFRAVHSIKGGAAAFSLDALVSFAHRFETALDLIRSDKLEVDTGLTQILHRSSDCLADLVAAARHGNDPDQGRCDALLHELDQLIDAETDMDTEFVFTPISIELEAVEDESCSKEYEIQFVPDAELYRTGNDPAALLRALSKLGTTELKFNADDVPFLEDWSEYECHLRWTILLETVENEAEVAAVFEFVEDCCELKIIRLSDNNQALERTSEDDLPSQDAEVITTKSESITLTQNCETTLEGNSKSTSAARPKKASVKEKETGQTGVTIRVNLERVDRLMNMIGELVIKEAMLSQVIHTAGLSDDPDVTAGLDAIRQLAGDIQESVMAIRAQPLKLVFQRMHRIVREAADTTGKQVRLITTGEHTEVDKTMVERLIDPLTHMIRNSVDHGLEDIATRLQRGKPAEGTITLSAAHRSGRVQIEVTDDGGGIDRAKVRQIAEERGLVSSDTSLSPGEIDQLLFLPGFSSKQEVSALSGRGVGLDVVRREIMDLGGRVMIDSEEGKGTTFSIALPLTLAVLEGMLIQLHDQTMVLPLSAVQETLRPSPSMLHGIGQAGRLLSSRGELIPIIDLACVFGLRNAAASLNAGGVLIVIETDNRKRAALYVDAIFDQRQVVIKSIEENYGRVPGVSAARILGDGKIALIIDPEEIVLSSSNDPTRSIAALSA